MSLPISSPIAAGNNAVLGTHQRSSEHHQQAAAVSNITNNEAAAVAASIHPAFMKIPGVKVFVDMWIGEPDDEIDRTTLRELCYQVTALALPTSVGNILMFSIQGITASFVGRRLGSDVFAHFMIGISVFNMFGLSIGSGLVAALDTLVSQSYGRHKQNSPEIGEYLQRATLVNALLMIPLGFLFLYGKPVWEFAFGEDGGAGAATFTENAVLYLFVAIMSSTLSRALASINEPLLPMYVNAVTAVACFFLNYYYTDVDILSAVHVLTATYTIYLVLIIAMFIFHPRVTFWRKCAWPSKKLFDRAGMVEYFDIGIPSLIAVTAEWWAFEVLQMIASNIGMKQVAELNMVTAVSNLMYSVALGVSVAASVRVGNALGENKPTLARRFALASLLVDQTFNAVNVGAVIIFNRLVSSIFTKEEPLQAEFSWLVFVLAVYHWGDSTQYLFQGIFRGAGMPHDAVKAVLLSLWLVGLPISFILGMWLHMGTCGIMLGIIAGFAVEMPLLYYSFSRWNWRSLAHAAAKDGELDQQQVLSKGGVLSSPPSSSDAVANATTKIDGDHGAGAKNGHYNHHKRSSSFSSSHAAVNIA